MTVKPTKREYEVLMLLMQGYEQQRAANTLGISPRTVYSYMRTLKGRFHAYSLEEVKERAVALKWIEYKTKPYDEIERVDLSTPQESEG